MASSGTNGIVHIWSRVGKKVSEFSLPNGGQCLSMDWDYEGEVLAVIVNKSGAATLWESSSQSVSQVETNMKELTFIAWSKMSPLLALGSYKGNLVLFNRRTARTIPVMGKHAGRITTGGWVYRDAHDTLSENLH